MSAVASKESLLSIALTKQKEIIRKILKEEETNDMKTTIANNLIRINDLQTELDEVKSVYKDKMKPLQKENVGLLQDFKNGFIDETLEVYLVPDYDNKIMEFYNEDGVKVGDRRMMMSEMQGRLSLK